VFHSAAAAVAFNKLHRALGPRTLDDVLPGLLRAINSSNEDRSANAMAGLGAVLEVRSHDVLPYLIPKLIRRPITELHANALAAVASVPGTALHHQIGAIMLSLVQDLAGEAAVNVRPGTDVGSGAGAGAGAGAADGGEAAAGDVGDETMTTKELDALMETPVAKAACAVVLNPTGTGASSLVTTLLRYLGSVAFPKRRRVAAQLLGHFVEHTTSDLEAQVQALLQDLVPRLNDECVTGSCDRVWYGVCVCVCVCVCGCTYGVCVCWAPCSCCVLCVVCCVLCCATLVVAMLAGSHPPDRRSPTPRAFGHFAATNPRCLPR